MNMKFSLIILLIVLLILKTFGQSWPVQQADDPNHYYIISGEFGEIHPPGEGYPAHFHRAIDINIDGNIEIRPIENGEVDAKGSISVIIKSNYSNGHWQRKTKYLHIAPSVNVGDQVTENLTILGYSTVSNSHLHFEMRVWNGSQYVVVPPLNNNSGWQLTLPVGHEDTYPPQINDIIIEALNNQTNNVSSGYSISDPNNNNGIVYYPNATTGPYRKVHVDDTHYGINFSVGPEYDYPNEKLIVWGNIAFILNVRDEGVNSPPGDGNTTPGGGEGLTIKTINYSIYDSEMNPQLKYDVDFYDFYDSERNDIDQFFRVPYFDPNHYLYGNNDFIELRSLDDTYLHIHRQINSIQSNGIWFTKALNTTPHVFNQTPTEIAYVNDVAKYKDGEQILNFYVSDASGQCEDYDLNVIVDNFPPYVKKVEILAEDPDDYSQLVYSAEWEWNSSSEQLEFLPNTMSGFLICNGSNSTDAYFKVTFSEPMMTAVLSVPYLSEDLIPISGSSDTEKIFFIDQYSFVTSIPGTQTMQLTGQDLAGTNLFGFSTENILSGTNYPKRTSTGSWQPPYSVLTDTKHQFETLSGIMIGVDFHHTNDEICSGKDVYYWPDCTGLISSYSWSFPGGSPSFSYEHYPPNIKYLNIGEYDVTLTVYDNDGNPYTLTKEDYIVVEQTPTADFSADLTTINIGESISFFDESSDNPVAWYWTFSGGLPWWSSNQNPEITYDNGGKYYVTLKAIVNSGCYDEITKEEFITVIDPRPIPDFNTSNGITNIEPGNYLDFEDLSTNDPTSWLWEFEGGTPSTSTEQDPENIQYPLLGAYDVTLHATNEFGTRSITKDDYIQVTNPAISLEIDCWPEHFIYTVGDEVKFTGMVTNGTPPYDYHFSFNGQIQDYTTGNTFVTASEVVGNPYENFMLTVTITDSSDPENTATCTTSVAVQQIGAGHNVGFSWSPASPILGQDLTFNNSTSGGAEPYQQSYWQWFEDPNTGYQPVNPDYEILWGDEAMDSPTVDANYDQLGDYPVTLTVTDALGWPVSETKVIHFIPANECIYFDGNYPILQLHQYPQIGVSTLFESSGHCCYSPDCDIQFPPDQVEFKVVSNIRWRLFDAITGGQIPNSEVYKYNECSCYEMGLNGSSECQSWFNFDYAGNRFAAYSFDLNDAKEYIIQCEIWNRCVGEFEATQGNPNYYLYNSLTPDQAVNLPYYDVAYRYFRVVDCNSSGIYSMDITNAENPEVWAGYITLSNQSYHNIYPGASIAYVAHHEITMLDGFTAFDGSNFTARIEPCPDYSDEPIDGFKNLNTNRSNGFITGPNVIKKSTPVQIKVLPNPNTGQFKVMLTNLTSNYSLTIMDNLGNIILEKWDIERNVVNVDIRNYAKGVYFLKVKTADKVFVEKVIRQ